MQDAITFLSEEEMKLRDEDKKWFAEEIARQLDEVVGSFKPHGWRKLVHLLRELGPIIGTCSFVLALIALVITLGIFSANKISQESEFRGTTTEQLKTVNLRLSGIENTLGFLRAQTVAQKYSTIPVPELKKHRDELATARKTLSSIPPDTPNYWPVSFQMITLLSQAQALSILETVGRKPVSEMSDVSRINAPPAIAFVVRETNVVLKNLIQGVTFENSVIHFDPSVRLVNDTFVNCVFVFPMEENPSKPLQQIGKTLLAADLSKVTLNAS